MTPPRALLFESFKKRNSIQVIAWATAWPRIHNIPPIYWHCKTQRWLWSPIHKKDIEEYTEMCEAVLKCRLGGHGVSK